MRTIDFTPIARLVPGLFGSALLGVGCVTVEPLAPDPYEAGLLEPGAAVEAISPVSAGDEIVICGQRFATGTAVVLWSDPGGYNGYGTDLRVGTNPEYRDKSSGRRYRPGRRQQIERGLAHVSGESERVADLARAVNQFVVHFDVCGLSRTCFDVLHDRRGLSVHFLLDIDGTIYQTLDLRETAWHATKANDRSIGIELAQIGARRPDDLAALREWYSTDEAGIYIDVPEHLGDGGVRTQPFRGRPARHELCEGTINGTRLVQYDFTPQQYDSLARLLASLTVALPGIEARVPRTRSGSVPTGQLPEDEYLAFAGILGHYHVQENKTDPGPAFDWERLMRDLRLRLLESGGRLSAASGLPTGVPASGAKPRRGQARGDTALDRAGPGQGPKSARVVRFQP